MYKIQNNSAHNNAWSSETFELWLVTYTFSSVNLVKIIKDHTWM